MKFIYYQTEYIFIIISNKIIPKEIYIDYIILCEVANIGQDNFLLISLKYICFEISLYNIYSLYSN